MLLRSENQMNIGAAQQFCTKVKDTDTFKGQFLAKTFFKPKLNITSLSSFSKTQNIKILKHARVINKNVFFFTCFFFHTRQSVISQLKRVSVRASRHVFRGKTSGRSFHVASLLFVYACFL